MRLLRTLLRQAARNRLMSLVNLLGLALSATVLILLGLLIVHEVRYDQPVPNSKRLVLIGSRILRANGQEIRWPIISAGVPLDLKREVPGIANYVRMRGNWENEFAMTRPETQVTTRGVFIVDSTFFDVTGIPLAQGDPNEALARPNTAVITRTFANRMFGHDDPMNQVFRYSGNRELTVAGVIERMPDPSMFADMQVLVSWPTFEERDDRSWGSRINHYCLLKLDPGITARDLRAPVDQATARHFTGDRALSPGDSFTVTLTPLRDVHLFGDYDPFPLHAGRYLFVLQFAAIGFFLLLIASLNFINLTTAQSFRRGLYVGVAKTLGASRAMLMRQFVGETVLTAGLSVLLGSMLALALLPAFSSMVNVDLNLSVRGMLELVVFSLASGLLYGVIVGLVPALMLSRTRPMSALRGTAARGKGGAKLRSALVILQFSIATGLVIASLVVLRQIHYIRTMNIGFNRENVLVVRLGNWDLMKSYKTFYDRFRNQPFVVSSSTADQLPIHSGNTSTYRLSEAPESESIFMDERGVDHGYLRTLGMNLVAGRNFDPDRSLDSTQAVIVNQTAVRELGIQGNPIGRTFKSIYDYRLGKRVDAEIIGVVADYQSQSMRDGIVPTFLRIYAGSPPWMIFRLQPGTEARAISELQKEWAVFAPDVPVQYSFLDERFDALYRTEQRLSSLFKLFTTVALVIAGLGLFALSAFVAERRTKEIGVRKVLGAQVGQIVTLLAGDFLKLVVIANLIAWPVVGWIMHRWLESYAFRTPLEWWLFAATFGASLLLALGTVSVHAIRASRTNPVNALRSE